MNKKEFLQLNNNNYSEIDNTPPGHDNLVCIHGNVLSIIFLPMVNINNPNPKI